VSDQYPCTTIAQMAAIPEDVLPDFLAEFPDILRHVRLIEASADGLAPALKAAAPWYLRWLPVGFFAETVRQGVNRVTFKNDKKGSVTLKARATETSPEFFSRTEKLEAGR
jgi:hypothetical protein